MSLLLGLLGCVSHAAPPAEPVAVPGVAPSAVPPDAAYVTFVVNVHDIHHVAESADTLTHLVRTFEAHHVRGDFYVTAAMTELFAAQRPDVIELLNRSGMGLSYHERPPSPTYVHFDDALASLDDAALASTLRDYEMYHQDLLTGELDRSRPGGYAYVSSTFGRPPTTVAITTGNARIRAAAFRVFAALGARGCVTYHEAGTALDRPFVWREGLLERPSDLGVTRWNVPGERPGTTENFWWNGIAADPTGPYNPLRHLQDELATWRGPRAPFVTVIAHENNFVRRGPETWTLMYFTDTTKTAARLPPWSMTPQDLSKVRPAAEQDAIWRAYDDLVGWAAEHTRVVTSGDLVGIAGGPTP